MGALGIRISIANITLGDKVDYPIWPDPQQHEKDSFPKPGSNLPGLGTESAYLDSLAFVSDVICKTVVSEVKTS